MLMTLNMYVASFYAIFLSKITKVKCFLSIRGIYIQIKGNYSCFIKNKAIDSCEWTSPQYKNASWANFQFMVLMMFPLQEK